MPNRTQFHSFEYDKNGNIVKEAQKDEKETADTTIVYNFNKGQIDYSNPQYMIKYNNTNILITRKFDEFGNVIFKEEIDEEKDEDKKIDTEIYKYEYDKVGNWVKKIVYDSFLQPKYIFLRKIEYYSTDSEKKETNKIKETEKLPLEKEYKINRSKEWLCTKNSALFVLKQELSKIGWTLEEGAKIEKINDCSFKIDFYATNDNLIFPTRDRNQVQIDFDPENETYNSQLLNP